MWTFFVVMVPSFSFPLIPSKKNAAGDTTTGDRTHMCDTEQFRRGPGRRYCASDDGVSLVMAQRCFVHVDGAILAGELHKLRYAEWCHWSLAQDGMAPGSSKTAVEMDRKTDT